MEKVALLRICHFKVLGVVISKSFLGLFDALDYLQVITVDQQ